MSSPDRVEHFRRRRYAYCPHEGVARFTVVDYWLAYPPLYWCTGCGWSWEPGDKPVPPEPGQGAVAARRAHSLLPPLDAAAWRKFIRQISEDSEQEAAA
jgi:hypothetical protein